MTQENKNEKWHVLVNPFGVIGVYVDSDYDPFLSKITSGAVSLLPLVKATIENKDMYETYKYVVKLHNDRLRFKQKQRAKKNREDGYVRTNPIKESYIDENGKWIVNGISSIPNTNRKTCRRCKQCKDGCEFYDKGICRGIVYPTYPPQYDKCEFDK